MAKTAKVNGTRDSHGRWQLETVRLCLGCKKRLPVGSFSLGGVTKAGSPHYRSRCKKCHAAEQAERRRNNLDRYRKYDRDYKARDPEKYRQKLRDYRRRIRQRGLDALGGRCVHCGRTNPKILTFGHIKNDGNEHRRRMKHPDAVYRDWDKRGWPKDEVELQCYNYNLGGSCD